MAWARGGRTVLAMMITLPPLDLSNLSPEIAAKITSYRPTSVDAATWKTWRKQVLPMALLAEPSSAEDLRGVLSGICTYLTWALPKYGESDLRAHFVTDRINRYIVTLTDEGATGTAENRRSQLSRVARALAGQPVRKAQTERDPYPPPFSVEEIARLRARRSPSPALTHALGLLDDRALTAQEWEKDLKTSEWAELRRDFAAAGLAWSHTQWRATWVAAVVTASPDFLLLATRYGLTRRDLDRYRDHHPAPAPNAHSLR